MRGRKINNHKILVTHLHCLQCVYLIINEVITIAKENKIKRFFFWGTSGYEFSFSCLVLNRLLSFFTSL